MSFKIILEIETEIDELNDTIDKSEKYLNYILNSGGDFFNVRSFKYWLREILKGVMSVNHDFPHYGEMTIGINEIKVNFK